MTWRWTWLQDVRMTRKKNWKMKKKMGNLALRFRRQISVEPEWVIVVRRLPVNCSRKLIGVLMVERWMLELLVLEWGVLKWKQVLPMLFGGELFLWMKKKRQKGSVQEIDSFADEILCERALGRTQMFFWTLKKWWREMQREQMTRFSRKWGRNRTDIKSFDQESSEKSILKHFVRCLLSDLDVCNRKVNVHKRGFQKGDRRVISSAVGIPEMKYLDESKKNVSVSYFTCWWMFERGPNISDKRRGNTRWGGLVLITTEDEAIEVQGRFKIWRKRERREYWASEYISRRC